ncbi:MAG: hypothetical protein AABZ12_01835 [Planctomycetota bacterium]
MSLDAIRPTRSTVGDGFFAAPPRPPELALPPLGSTPQCRLQRVVSLALALVALSPLSPGLHAEIEVEVVHVGFPAIPEGDVVRNGVWAPIVVDVTLVGQQAFDGLVRTAQLDADGDEAVDSAEIHLRSDTGGTQRIHLFVPINSSRGDHHVRVELRDLEGDVVRVTSRGEVATHAGPAAPPTAVGHDEVIILYLSSATVGRLADLVYRDAAGVFTQPVHVAHLAPEELPELPLALEAVDFIVWDDARPETLTTAQTTALIDWVGHGGTLLIAASRTVGSLNLAKTVNPLLPADLGDLTTVDNLPTVRQALLDPPTAKADQGSPVADWLDISFPDPVPVIRAKARPGATVVARDGALDSDVVTRRRLGRGHLIFSAVTLKDLFSAPCSIQPLFRKLFHLVKQGAADQINRTPESLFDKVAAAVAFSTSSGLYVLLATAFSIGYVALATFGTWTFLGWRGWRRHSWTTFAATSVLAGGFSLMAVGSIRGFADRAHQLCIVDLDAGEREAYATAYIGIKTAVDKTIDVWLPSDWVAAREPAATPCFIRPIPVGSAIDEGTTSFADPSVFRLRPGSAILENVRMRGTLKRFEARWKGSLKGSVQTDVRIENGRIAADSYLVNNLGFDLHKCLLLQARIDPDATATYRDGAINVHYIGDLPAGGQKVLLAPRCYASPATALAGDGSQPSLLQDAQAAWTASIGPTLRTFGGQGKGHLKYDLDQSQNALLLASTIGEFDPSRHGGALDRFGLNYWTWSRDRLRHLDLRSQMTAGRAGSENSPPRQGSLVLIGFASDPGPLRVFTRSHDDPFRVLHPEPEASWSMYRIRIPVTRLGGEPADSTQGDADPESIDQNGKSTP